MIGLTSFSRREKNKLSITNDRINLLFSEGKEQTIDNQWYDGKGSSAAKNMIMDIMFPRHYTLLFNYFSALLYPSFQLFSSAIIPFFSCIFFLSIIPFFSTIIISQKHVAACRSILPHMNILFGNKSELSKYCLSTNLFD